MKTNINKDAILNDFDGLAKAKKANSTNFKLCLIFALVIVVLVLFWAFSVSQTALNKVVVIDRSGTYLQTVTANTEDLFNALVKNTCAQAVQYVNSFDRLTLKENQARAKFYINTNDLNAIFQQYKDEKVYYDVLQGGAVYKCKIEEVQTINGNNEPYNVKFTAILTLYAPSGQTFNYRVFVEGEIIRTNAQFPENVTGFFFNKYIQQIKPIIETKDE